MHMYEQRRARQRRRLSGDACCCCVYYRSECGGERVQESERDGEREQRMKERGEGKVERAGAEDVGSDRGKGGCSLRYSPLQSG